MTYTLSATVPGSFDDAVAAVRQALADNGFGVLTEINLQATLKAKLGVDIDRQLILGACRPQLAHAAIQVEPSIGVLLPCTVVVRESGAQVLVEALDPHTMVTVTDNEALAEIVDEVAGRLTAAVEQVSAG